MEFVPYENDADKAKKASLGEVICSALLSIYQEKNHDASESDLQQARTEILLFISEIKQKLEEAVLPLKATIQLAERQCVSLGQLDKKLADEIVRADDVDALIGEKIALPERMDSIINKINRNPLIKPYEILFQQTINAYKTNAYDLAVLGFFAITDGLLSDITKDYRSTQIKQRVEKIVNANDIHIPKDEAHIDSMIQQASVLLVTELLAKSEFFDREEPEALNRHWAMHGRTRAKKTKVDCEKLILYIYALLDMAGRAKEKSDQS